MADDIIQKGLNLQVEAEDLASPTILGIGDDLEALQARAETAFGAIAMSGEDAASSLNDAAALFAPEWESQLEALSTLAGGVFADIAVAVETAATSISGSAATIAASLSDAVKGIGGGTDAAAGSLDALQSDMEATAGVAEQTSGEISDAYDASSLGLDAGAGALDGLQSSMEATAGTAASTAGKISTSYDVDSLGLDAGAGSLKGLQSEMTATSKTATSTSADIGKSYSTNTLKLDAGSASLRDLQTQMDEAAATAKADAGEIAAAFGDIGVSTGAADAGAAAAAAGGGAAADGSVSGISFGKGADGKAKGFKIPTPSLSHLMTGGVTAAIGLGAVDVGMSQLQGLASLKAQTGMTWGQTLTTAATAKGVGLGTDQIQRLIQHLDTNIGKLDQQTVSGATVEGHVVGMGFGRQAIDPSTLKAVTSGLGGGGGAALALKTLGIGPDQLTGLNAQQQLALIAEKLDGVKNNTLRTAVTQELFGKGTDTAHLMEQFTLATTEAQKNLPKGLAKDLAMTLGSGKSMVDFQEQMFYLEVEMSAALMKMVPLLSKIMGEASKHTTLLMDIALGAGAAGVANKVLGHTGGGSIASVIEKVLGKAASKGGGAAAGAAAGAAGSEGAGVALTGALGGLEFASIPFLMGGDQGPHGLGQVAKKAPTVASMLSSGIMTSQIEKAAQAYAKKHHESTQGDLGAMVASDKGLGAYLEHFALTSLASNSSHAQSTIPGLSPKFFASLGGTWNPHTRTALEAASGQMFGLPPGLVEAIAKREGGVDPATGKPRTSPSGAEGLMQLMPATAASMIKELFGKTVSSSQAKSMTSKDEGLNLVLGSKYLSDLYHQSGGNVLETAAGYNAGGGIIGKGKKGLMEHTPGASAAGGFPKDTVGAYASQVAEWQKQIDQSLTKSETSSKTHAPKVKKPVEDMLKELVTDAAKHGKEFSDATDQSLTNVEKYLKNHKAPFSSAGKELMKGLEQGLDNELPVLEGQARKIAADLEATLKQALKVKSPSEMTAEIGEHLMAGLGVGIERGTSATQDVARSSALSVVGAIGSASMPGAAPVGGEQTIIVMLDSAEVARAVNKQTHGTVKLVAKLP